MRFIEYCKTLPLARELYEASNPPPTTHDEWAKSFNKIAAINRIIIKHNTLVHE